jgi:hypothetical protein
MFSPAASISESIIGTTGGGARPNRRFGLSGERISAIFPEYEGIQGIGAITSLENELSTLFKLIEVTT